MPNSIFPELDGWDDINSSGGTIGTGINKAIHRLVISIANLRSGTSSKLGYLNDKIERLNENIKNANESSENLAKALNSLTLWGVIVAGSGVILALIQFLYTNHIWPFTH